MHELILIIQRFVSKTPPTKLGRWARESCLVRTNTKIDRANTDHCGTCVHETAKEKQKPNETPV